MSKGKPRSEFLPFAPPCVGDAEVQAVTEVLKGGVWLSSGPKTREFEEKFSAKVGAESALALNSATAGLQLALAVLNVGPGDEVIVPSMTFCASANVAEHLGATVRLADVNPETLLIDVDHVERLINPRTKVIMPVHYAGHPCAMDRINTLARDRKIHVVEDAAHCMPSKIGEKWVGSNQNLTAFSFYANKNMTTGEGGMLTGPKERVDQARVLALHGMSRGAWDRFAKGGNWRYDVPAPGYKFNMTDMAAALGVVQLSRLDELYERRLKLVRLYDQAFRGHDFLSPLKVLEGYQSSHHLYVLQLNLEKLTIDRDRFIVELTERNIGTSVHYVPLHMMSYYAGKYNYQPESLPHALKAFQRIVSIPLSSQLKESDAADVVFAVNEVALKFKK